MKDTVCSGDFIKWKVCICECDEELMWVWWWIDVGCGGFLYYHCVYYGCSGWYVMITATINNTVGMMGLSGLSSFPSSEIYIDKEIKH